eukprot:TRINITY_DN42222_c0_g1_i1.p1 TRINITY_DN42222_c0_g1~~TRINITY_DN42222_c0_g1_i1.p1  ORF type:complete len:115 (-),score=37.95 TRINITY_DN42222_c0_g1_i1:247-591(-)
MKEKLMYKFCWQDLRQAPSDTTQAQAPEAAEIAGTESIAAAGATASATKRAAKDKLCIQAAVKAGAESRAIVMTAAAVAETAQRAEAGGLVREDAVKESTVTAAVQDFALEELL